MNTLEALTIAPFIENDLVQEARRVLRSYVNAHSMETGGYLYIQALEWLSDYDFAFCRNIDWADGEPDPTDLR